MALFVAFPPQQVQLCEGEREMGLLEVKGFGTKNPNFQNRLEGV